MDLWILVARHTVRFRLHKVAGRMTLTARDLRMTADQRKDVMIERLQVTMARKAIGAVFSNMLIDKDHIDFAMTRLAP